MTVEAPSPPLNGSLDYGHPLEFGYFLVPDAADFHPRVRGAKHRRHGFAAARPPVLKPGRRQRPHRRGGSTVSTTHAPDQFSTLPDEQTLTDTVVALEEHGFSVEVVDDLDAAREAVLARIPEGASVMTNTSVTLQQTGIADAIDGGGPYDSARTKMMALDFATQLPEMKAIAGQPDYALGSVHAITRDGTLRHRLRFRQPARLLRLGRGQRHLRRRRAEARRPTSRRPTSGSSSTACRSRTHAPTPPTAEQPRRQDPRDPPGGSRPHPRRPHPPAVGF